MRRIASILLVLLAAAWAVGGAAAPTDAAAAAPTNAAAAAAATVQCRPPAQGQGPKNDRSLPIGLLSARGMACRAARTAIRNGSFRTRGGCFGGPGGSPCVTTFTTRGFRCTAPMLGDFRCTAPGRRFKFAWGE